MTGGNIGAARRRRLAEAMAENGVDLLVVYGNAWQGDYLRYASDYGILEGDGLAVVRKDGSVTLFLDSPLEADRAAIESPGVETVYARDMLRDVETLLERSRNSRIATAPKRLMPQRLAARSADLGIADKTAMMDRLLMKKLDCEIAAIRAAAHVADEGYAIFRNAARNGRTDYELVAEVEAFFRAHGVDDNFMIIGVGGTEVRGMAPPMGKKLKQGDLVTTELTPCVDGYYIQICRTLVIGEPAADHYAAFGVYRDALEAGVAAVRPGITAADIARAENEIFRAHGLGEYVTDAYTRVRGHGLGLFADTKPHLLENVTTPIEENMTLIVHPNTYHPAVGYMVLGDAVIVTPDGAEILTKTPRELFAVPAN
ncbi:MAG TPA: M24 family metallopeptidase [Micropepsaceae bacterium]|jgi:Xaa-Pro aminopeptidase|nr:M24 family metallopeptidase [Micropepsaceae bacterium]